MSKIRHDTEATTNALAILVKDVTLNSSYRTQVQDDVKSTTNVPSTSVNGVKLNSWRVRQIQDRRYIEQFAHSSSKMTLQYNICTMHETWEEYWLPLTPSGNVCNDSIRISTSLGMYGTPRNTSRHFCMGVLKNPTYTQHIRLTPRAQSPWRW